MEKTKLGKVADVIGAALPQGMDSEALVSEAAAYLDGVRPGCLYFELEPGTAETALQCGAAAAVCRGEGPGKITADDPLEALNRLAAWHRRLFQTWIIGITGSVGKTMVKDIVHELLQLDGGAKKSSWALEGEAGLPLALLNLNWSDRNAVLEIGFTRPGNIGHMSRIIRPSAALITCVGTGHLTQCGDREALLAEKLSVTEGMNVSSPLILNGDDDLLQRACERISQEKITYGLDSPWVDVKGRILSQNLQGSELEVSCYGKKERLQVPLWGKLGARNALAAFTVGIVAGLDTGAAARCISAFRPALHSQSVLSFEGATVLDDNDSSSPESMREALRYLEQLPAKRRVAVLGEMPDLGETAENAHRAIGRRAAQCGADLICCLGPYAEAIAVEANRMGGTRALTFTSRESLVTFLQNDRRVGDAVLVKGSRDQKMEEIIPLVWGTESQ